MPPGRATENAVASAANFLKKFNWIDSTKLAIQGHSLGGFETNYLVTHSHLFAAAVEAAGASDMISRYGSLYGGIWPMHAYYETIDGAMRCTLWDDPDLYISESPVFKANEVTTPLLMMHNKKDAAVPWAQGIELFTALRRLQKPVWLLQYDGAGHSLRGKNSIDYTLRMEGFFNYYLKSMPPPKWMTDGISPAQKGYETGFDLDYSGKKP
jgi:dipeptidyl aminopeptidase/acylaminoacyl peptidase